MNESQGAAQRSPTASHGRITRESRGQSPSRTRACRMRVVIMCGALTALGRARGRGGAARRAGGGGGPRRAGGRPCGRWGGGTSRPPRAPHGAQCVCAGWWLLPLPPRQRQQQRRRWQWQRRCSGGHRRLSGMALTRGSSALPSRQRRARPPTRAPLPPPPSPGRPSPSAAAVRARAAVAPPPPSPSPAAPPAAVRWPRRPRRVAFRGRAVCDAAPAPAYVRLGVVDAGGGVAVAPRVATVHTPLPPYVPSGVC